MRPPPVVELLRDAINEAGYHVAVVRDTSMYLLRVSIVKRRRNVDLLGHVATIFFAPGRSVIECLRGCDDLIFNIGDPDLVQKLIQSLGQIDEHQVKLDREWP